MHNVDTFIEEVVRDMAHRASLLGDCGDRRALEDGIAMLTDYRVSGMDETRFGRLLASLREGRSPVGLRVLKPAALAVELTARWQSYTARIPVPAVN